MPVPSEKEIGSRRQRKVARRPMESVPSTDQGSVPDDTHLAKVEQSMGLAPYALRWIGDAEIIPNDRVTAGQRLHWVRRLRNRTSASIAIELGVRSRQIHLIERDQKIPEVTVLQLCAALKVSVDAIIAYESPNSFKMRKLSVMSKSPGQLATLGDRLLWARLRCGYTQTRMAAHLEMSQHVLSLHENDRVHRPPRLRDLANLLEVTPAWLLMGGADPESARLPRARYPLDTLAERLQWLRENYRITRNALAQELGCLPAKLTRIEQGNNAKPEFIRALARWFKVPVRWMLTGDESHSPWR